MTKRTTTQEELRQLVQYYGYCDILHAVAHEVMRERQAQDQQTAMQPISFEVQTQRQATQSLEALLQHAVVLADILELVQLGVTLTMGYGDVMQVCRITEDGRIMTVEQAELRETVSGECEVQPVLLVRQQQDRHCGQNHSGQNIRRSETTVSETTEDVPGLSVTDVDK